MALPSLMNLTGETETSSVGVLPNNYTRRWNQPKPETQDVNFVSTPTLRIKFHDFDIELQTTDIEHYNQWLASFTKIIMLNNYIEAKQDEDLLEDIYLNLEPKAEYKVNVKITEVTSGKPSPFFGEEVESDAWD